MHPSSQYSRGWGRPVEFKNSMVYTEHPCLIKRENQESRRGIIFVDSKGFNRRVMGGERG